VRRHPEHGALQHVVGEHLETFLAEAHQRGDGEGLPRFVERELRAFHDTVTPTAPCSPADCDGRLRLVAGSPTAASSSRS